MTFWVRISGKYQKRKNCGLLDEFGFKNSITSATRKTLTSESMIDYIVTNLEENNIISVKDSVDLALSDHSMQIIEVLVKDILKNQVYAEIRVKMII